MTSPRQGHTPDCGWPDDHMGACPEPHYRADEWDLICGGSQEEADAAYLADLRKRSEAPRRQRALDRQQNIERLISNASSEQS